MDLLKLCVVPFCDQVVWELGEFTAPFTLAVENLRPDLVRVDMPPLPLQLAPAPSSRRKRSVDPRWFTFHRDASATLETKNKTETSQQRPEWLGPTVFLLREDESFIGRFICTEVAKIEFPFFSSIQKGLKFKIGQFSSLGVS